MAKKTLESIKKCPIDFLYLWASDEFISQLGDKASIIKQKKYNQHQSLWVTMVENTKGASQAELQDVYVQWTNEIAKAIKDVYGMSPSVILQKLALGEEVLGKNWKAGVYGVSGLATTFTQNQNATVDPTTGKILIDGQEAPDQTPIYSTGDGENATITGYSYFDITNIIQYQSALGSDGKFGAMYYANSSGVQTAGGAASDASEASFWQNANNYMPMVNNVLTWLMSLADTYAGRVKLTTANTVPSQTEWLDTTVRKNNTTLWIVGGAAAGGLALWWFNRKKKKGKKSKE